MIVEVTIGWTKSDMENGYSSFSGYKPGAQQHTEVVEVEVGEDFAPTYDNVLELAESAFTATNHPEPERLVGFPQQIYWALVARGFNGSQSGHYSLSTGDTVTVGEVMVACESFGWKRVSMGVSA